MSSGFFTDGNPYLCKFAWPDDCFCQGGDDGMVFTEGTLADALTNPEKAMDAITGKTEHYTTAFFEAFPRSPDTFIRGEGKTVEAAEADAWTQFQKFSACAGHEWEKRGYTNGAGFCKHCGMFSGKAFEPVPPSPSASIESERGSE